MNRIAIFAVALMAVICSGNDAVAKSPADLPIEAFAQLPKLGDVELSPDGKHLAFLAPVKGRNHLIIQTLGASGKPVVIPPVDKWSFGWLRWANEERVVFSISSFERDKFVETTQTRLGSITRDGSALDWLIKNDAHLASGLTSKGGHSVTGRNAQIQDDVIDWLPDDPQHILVSIDSDVDGDYEVRRIDVSNGDFKNVRSGIRGVQNWMTDAQGNVRIGWGYIESDFQVKMRDANNEWKKLTRSQWWDDGYRPISFTQDSNVVYVKGPNDAGIEVLRKLNLASGEFLETVFEHDTYDIGGLLNDSITGEVVGYYFGPAGEKKYIDSSHDIMQRSMEKANPGKSIKLVSMSADQQQVLVKVFSADDPGIFYFWDRATKRLDAIAEVMPGLDPALMSAAKPISYPARDGTDIPGFLTLPQGNGAKNLPTVVLPHGGPHARTYGDFYFITQFLVSRGYAVLQPNFRGSTGYGEAFEEAGRKQWGGLMQDDVTDGAKWLVKEGIADADRMCIVGWSYGGYAAAMGAIKTPDLFRCAASINGVLDLAKLVKDDKKYIGGSDWVKSVGLDGEKVKSVSPYHQVARVAVPMLIIQAMDDSRVHADQGERMVKALKKAKKPVEYVTVDLGGHSMNNQPAREAILRSLESFLSANIGQ